MPTRCLNERCPVSILELESSFAHVSPQFGNVRCLCCISDKLVYKSAVEALLAYHYGFLSEDSELGD